MMIECDPDLAAAFHKSSMVSSKYSTSAFLCRIINNNLVSVCLASKGSGANLLKIGSKRRRTNNEIAGEKVMQQMNEEEAKENARKVRLLQDELDLAKKNADTFQDAAQMLENLFQSGQAKMGADGQVIILSQQEGDNFRVVSPVYKQD